MQVDVTGDAVVRGSATCNPGPIASCVASGFLPATCTAVVPAAPGVFNCGAIVTPIVGVLPYAYTVTCSNP